MRVMPGELPDAPHVITVSVVNQAGAYGHPVLRACCACGWRDEPRSGRHGDRYAEADGALHLRITAGHGPQP